jgi:mannosyltransferase OCH1-like enzyme
MRFCGKKIPSIIATFSFCAFVLFFFINQQCLILSSSSTAGTWTEFDEAETVVVPTNAGEELPLSSMPVSVIEENGHNESDDKKGVNDVDEYKYSHSHSHSYIMNFQQFWNESMILNNNKNEYSYGHRPSQTHQHDIHTHTSPPEHKWLKGGKGKFKSANTSMSMRTGTSTSTTSAYSNHININSSNNTIPNIINKIYIDNSGMFPSIQEMNLIGQGSLTNAHKSWSIHNPNYKIRYFNLNSCRKYIMEHFHPIFLRTFDCIQAFAGKVDLFRMLVVYAEGGWYSDWKQECIHDRLLDKIGKDVDFYGAWDHGHEGLAQDQCLQNCFFGAKPRHPLIATMIQMILVNVQSEHYEKHALFSTATCLFGRAFRKYRDEQNQEATRLKLDYFKDAFIRNSSDPSGYENYVRHKCNNCGTGQDWDKGNNYNHLWEKNEFYCEDAKALFTTTATINVKNDTLLW